MRGGAYPYQLPGCANITPRTDRNVGAECCRLSSLGGGSRCEGVVGARGLVLGDRCRDRPHDRNERPGLSRLRDDGLTLS